MKNPLKSFARWVPDAALPGSPANPPEWLCRGPGDRVRHWVCLLGVEDLDGLARMPQLFANKLWPAVDEGAVRCWHAHIRRRTLQQQQEVEEGRRRRPPFPLLQKEVYTELPAVGNKFYYIYIFLDF